MPRPHPTHNIGQLPRRHAAARPDAPAYLDADGILTWGELNAKVNSLASRLARSMEPGNRLAVVAGNSARYWVVQYAAAKIGAVIVPINHRLLPHEIAAILCDVGARALVLDAVRGPGRAGRRAPVETLVLIGGGDPRGIGYDEAVADQSAPEPPEPTTELNVIASTSGTSGRPKGAMLTHESSLVNAGMPVPGRTIRS